jgi:lipopolysaccharide biosynthesis glycosyltransferase
MINILVTLNSNYIPPLKVLLKSLFVHNKDEQFTIYLIHSELTKQELDLLRFYIEEHGQHFYPIFVKKELFNDAPVFRHYSVEMYYRLVAHLFLPDNVDRILYLDPDIVAINPITDFYYTEFDDCLFVAAEHEHIARFVKGINNLRLNTPFAKGYFNTGVLLMNVTLMRKLVSLKEIYQFIKKNKYKLILPDQDVLNGLYWDKIKPVDSYRYNYDARFFKFGKISRKIAGDLSWIKKNTIFIHYCGKDKPWRVDYKGGLGIFYQRYAEMIQSNQENILSSKK